MGGVRVTTLFTIKIRKTFYYQAIELSIYQRSDNRLESHGISIIAREVSQSFSVSTDRRKVNSTVMFLTRETRI